MHVTVAPLLMGSGRPAMTLSTIQSLEQALRPRCRHFVSVKTCLRWIFAARSRRPASARRLRPGLRSCPMPQEIPSRSRTALYATRVVAQLAGIEGLNETIEHGPRDTSVVEFLPANAGASSRLR